MFSIIPMIGTLEMTVEIWVPGKPQQWNRGSPFRGANGGVFISKTKKDRTAQAIIRECFNDYLRLHPEKSSTFPWCSAVRMQTQSVYKLPKKYRRKDGFYIFEKTSTPDTSNLIKQIEDSFNTIMGSELPSPYFDDAQITQVYGQKGYHPYIEGVMVTMELWKSDHRFIHWEDFPNQYEGEDYE